VKLFIDEVQTQQRFGQYWTPPRPGVPKLVGIRTVRYYRPPETVTMDRGRGIVW
jgi:hypothetical protein